MTEDVAVTHDIIGLHDGRPLLVHLPEKCAGRACCIHNPSDHPLRDAPLNWRGDRRIMERTCPHGVGHPDPDDLMVRRAPRTGSTVTVATPLEVGLSAASLHGCDGCCSAATP